MADQQIKQEKIGKVTMDYTYYPGEDFYTDGGAIEEEMLEIAMHCKPSDFPKMIEQKKSWPVFYHFSPFRTNCIDWLPFQKTDKVLEIGSGCGAITGALARRAGSVTCVDLSKKRSLVNAYRNQMYDNITVLVGNFREIEPHLATDYDYVLLIGVFEYGQAYIGGLTPYEDFMRICNRHRKQDGRLVIAIENKFGLKYWAGCREDHLGTYFSGLEGYREGGSARTFTRHGLEQILEKVGLDMYTFYYPYPDYKFATSVYSDRRLPRKGELSNNLRNFDRDRLLLFDEKQVFDQIIEEKEFPLFSNSYLLVAGSAPEVIYAKFSNDRAPEWAIRTLMVCEKPDQVQVIKQPDTAAACNHLEHTRHVYEQLSRRYAGTKIDINQCSVIDGDLRNGLAFSFCGGVTLEALLDDCLTRADEKRFRSLINEYMYWLSYQEEQENITNIDFIFPNILVDGDTWHIIDYEWTFDRHIGAREVAFRAFYNYTLGGEARKSCEHYLMQDVLQFSPEQIAAAIEKERNFQSRVTGSHASVERVRELIGNRVYALDGIISYCFYLDKQCQLFMDYGDGFDAENSVWIEGCYTEGGILTFVYDLPEGIRKLRIDPCSYRCAVEVKKIQVNNRCYAQEEIIINGVWQENSVAVFDTEDPNFTVEAAGGKLTVHMEVFAVPQKLAEQLTKPQETVQENIEMEKKSFLQRHMPWHWKEK